MKLWIYICIVLVTMASLTSLQSQTKQPNFVLIHGTWGGGWAFKSVDSMLTEKGTWYTDLR